MVKPSTLIVTVPLALGDKISHDKLLEMVQNFELKNNCSIIRHCLKHEQQYQP